MVPSPQDDRRQPFEIITYLLGEAPEQSWPLYNSWLRISVAATL